jgi:two-component system, chemotaxis family, chemotaxis protein CheY
MGKTIMIIDDATAIRQVVELTLKESGYDTVQASDGNDALSKINGARIDLIICDVNMPNLNGIGFLEALKNDDKYSSYKFTPIIMLTTEAGEDMKNRGKELGAKAWLVKPFKPDQLLSSVEKLLP